MMKKIIVVLLVVVLMAVFCVSAFAEGEVPLERFFGGGLAEDLVKILLVKILSFLGIFFPIFR